MKKIAEAIIVWGKEFSLGEINQRISPIMKFKDDDQDGLFSSIIINKSFLNNYQTLSIISYLIPNAPFDSLIKDATFDLYDGPNLIGTGKVLKVMEGEFINVNGKWIVNK